MRTDAPTRAYVLGRRAEGKSDREIRRSLKRYIARQLYRTLTTAMKPNTATSACTNRTGPPERRNLPKDLDTNRSVMPDDHCPVMPQVTAVDEQFGTHRLLDLAKRQGFAFQRVASREDGPLFARRETIEYRDEIYIGGFSDSCHATRARKSSLIVAGDLPVTAQVSGDALTVLHIVVSDWP
jgi:hypothetical protein